MDEQFDEKLKNRITEVFDNYEFPPADEAWLELRKKFPVKEERKVAWLWWSSAAAILMIFLGLGLWFNNKQNAGNNTIADTHSINKPDSVKQITKEQNNNIAVTPSQTATHPANGTQSDSISAIKPAGVDNNSRYNAGATKTTLDKYAPVVNKKPFTVDNNNPYTATINNPATGKNNPAIGNNPVSTDGPANSIAQQTPNKTAAADNLPANNQNPAINNPAKQQVAVANVPAATTDGGNTPPAENSKTSSVIVKQPAKTMEDLLNESRPQQVAQQKAEKKELKKVNFSVYAATYLNYAEGSANQVNAGAGFTSDIRLSKNVKLSTGVALAQNTLSYAGSVPVSSENRAMSANYSSPSSSDNGLFNPAASVAELKGTNASLMGLDIPINIKYEFDPDKNDTYISAGLSSGTFIDERYTYRYAYRNNSSGYSAVTTQDQTSTQSFNSFYFGKTLNLSFGTGFPIGKTNRLVIEPFLKYPLGGLGTQSIHFGAGGINLKFNFKATKK